MLVFTELGPKAAWEEVQAIKQRTYSGSVTPRNITKSNRRRCVALACAGNVGKAAKALLGSGVREDTPETRRILLSLHPQDKRPMEDEFAHEPSFASKPFKAKEVIQCIRKSKRALSAGGTGLSFDHLRECITLSGETGGQLASRLARLATLVAQGKLAQPTRDWFMSAPCTPLVKSGDPNKARPIAVGDCTRRLTGQLLASRIKEEVQILLFPRQVGVGTRCAAEATHHVFENFIQEFGASNEFAILKIDLENAFNLVSRPAILFCVQKYLPQLYGYTDTAYGAASAPHVWYCEFKFLSAQGVQQGDPLGPLLFALVLHHFCESTTLDIDEEKPNLEIFYLDDGTFLGPHKWLVQQLERFGSDEAKRHGFHLRSDKTHVWWPTSISKEHRELYPADTKFPSADGINIFGNPVGGAKFYKDFFRESTEKCERGLRELKYLNNLHVAMDLLRQCFSTGTIQHLFRVTPPHFIIDELRALDDKMRIAFNEMASVSVSERLWEELMLPIQSRIPDTSTLGIGILSAKARASSAFIAPEPFLEPAHRPRFILPAHRLPLRDDPLPTRPMPTHQLHHHDGPLRNASHTM